jgi:hypothetical protein
LFLHIGEDVLVPLKDIIAILDLRLNKSETTKEFLQIGDDEGFVEIADKRGTSTPDKLKTFIVTTNKIYYTSISSGTLVKRAIAITSQPKLKDMMKIKKKTRTKKKMKGILAPEKDL